MEPFIGEIKMFAGNFAPRGFALCDGQLLAVSQNDALFSLLGTIYGGDGRTTFALPDLRGRLPVHFGQGPGLPSRTIGARSGQETVTITQNQMPAHTHSANALNKPGDSGNPQDRHWAADMGADKNYTEEPADTPMDSNNLTATGGVQSHTNLMPFLCVNFIIALVGIYPSRN